MNYAYGPIDIKKEIWSKYNDEINELGHLLIETIKEDEAFNDLMSDFIENNDAYNKRLAQYFSPKDIADTLGMINFMTSTIEDFEGKNRMRIGDPGGCGAGSLILGALRQLKNIEGFTQNYYQSLDVYMVDIDEDLAKIAFFQVLLNSLLHAKPLGKLFVEAKNVITEYSITKNPMIFISNITLDFKSINNPNFKINTNKAIAMLDDVFKKAA